MSAATAEPSTLLPMLSAQDVARLLDVSPALVYRLTASGEFPVEPVRLGRVLRFRRSDVLALLGEGGGRA